MKCPSRILSTAGIVHATIELESNKHSDSTFLGIHGPTTVYGLVSPFQMYTAVDVCTACNGTRPLVLFENHWFACSALPFRLGVRMGGPSVTSVVSPRWR